MSELWACGGPTPPRQGAESSTIEPRLTSLCESSHRPQRPDSPVLAERRRLDTILDAIEHGYVDKSVIEPFQSWSDLPALAGWLLVFDATAPQHVVPLRAQRTHTDPSDSQDVAAGRSPLSGDRSKYPSYCFEISSNRAGSTSWTIHRADVLAINSST